MKCLFKFLFVAMISLDAHASSLYLTGQVPQKLKFLWKSGQMYLEANNAMPLRVFIHKKKSRGIASESETSYVVISGELFNEEDLKDVDRVEIVAP